MKILSITFMFLTLMFSSEKTSEVDYFNCQPGSTDYCTGYADGQDAESGWNMTGAQWRSAHNSCMSNRGCDPIFKRKVPTIENF
ncbi:MAG: hypothetical protein ACJA2M_002198 [Polaribacter sp.]|jgi:hypothetical protein